MNVAITERSAISSTKIVHQKGLHKEIIISLLWGIVLLALSLVINYFANTYATFHASSSVRDIILDNIPTFDVDGIFLYGIAAFFVLAAGLLVWKPRNAPFVLKSVSLFIIVRSFFVCLTHIGPPLTAISIPTHSIADLFTSTGDLFFSAHTGLPFLMAMIYWDHKVLRTVFLLFTIALAVVVLLGHLHYSIDVFSAFFITYGVLQIARYFFPKDYAVLHVVNK